jgi:hypothetical protein
MISGEHNHAMGAGSDANPAKQAAAHIHGDAFIVYANGIDRAGTDACPAIFGAGSFDFRASGKPVRQCRQRPGRVLHGPVFLFISGFQNAQHRAISFL